eukprot:TRINITY_DN97750_c0_g1_i1.p1 TRINITY_DN97750_c0_g1~~TRINITY_DN97750_c0_g1_i1.p1  ORF type:complete len:205 (-),score=44.11 TRINITY_DN97750_c0_g1_i1:70-627(-)
MGSIFCCCEDKSHVAKQEHLDEVDHHSDDEEPENHFDIDIQTALDVHNTFRAKHGAPPLVWDNRLAEHALAAAQVCFAEDTMRHNNHEEFNEGQNIYTSWDSGQDGSKVAVAGWYSEIDDYDFGNPGFSHEAGHFTQVVWRGSQQVGMAKVRGDINGSDRVFIVANYSPRGNMLGEFEQSVLPPQ